MDIPNEKWKNTKMNNFQTAEQNFLKSRDVNFIIFFYLQTNTPQMDGHLEA